MTPETPDYGGYRVGHVMDWQRLGRASPGVAGVRDLCEIHSEEESGCGICQTSVPQKTLKGL